MAYGFKYNKTPGRSPGKRSYTPKDIKRVEENMEDDPYYNFYKKSR